MRKPFERYTQSGEINTQVDDTSAVIAGQRAMAALRQDHLDG